MKKKSKFNINKKRTWIGINTSNGREKLIELLKEK